MHSTILIFSVLAIVSFVIVLSFVTGGWDSIIVREYIRNFLFITSIVLFGGSVGSILFIAGNKDSLTEGSTPHTLDGAFVNENDIIDNINISTINTVHNLNAKDVFIKVYSIKVQDECFTYFRTKYGGEFLEKCKCPDYE